MRMNIFVALKFVIRELFFVENGQYTRHLKKNYRKLKKQQQQFSNIFFFDMESMGNIMKNDKMCCRDLMSENSFYL